ncbi:hypothetical protein [Vibrio mediterranei]|uniref:hypothetical protein n=1 Tax=Vibrio mediterranei TaxID=689 RepID=UPI004068DA4B
MRKITCALVATVLLMGCTSNKNGNAVIPDSEYTLLEVYEDKVARSSEVDQAKSIIRRAPTSSELAFDPYLQNGTAYQSYRLLPNPTLYIYFPPSLSAKERLPTPGWMTEFKMYDRDEYALPGETTLTGGDR